tara:strand:+ start:1170 stop:1982 length:813 start_codon:yes stop_codon:yes gene_type:complete
MSKKVTLRQQEVNNHLPKEVQAEAVYKLSSVYINRQPLRGFTGENEKKYLQNQVDVTPDHVEWPKHTKEFWVNLTIPVGWTGIELEVGMDQNEEPIQIMDWIKYNFALNHPQVALTKDEMDRDQSKRFYIQDLNRDDKARNNNIQIRKDADKEFIKVSSDLKNMKRVLRLMANLNPDRMTAEQVENSLYEIKNKDPKKFFTIATDKNLELKSELEEMVSAGVIRKIGNQVIFIDEILGDTIDDTIIHLKDKKNSSKLTLLRAKLKELSLV